jgi:hypothetical protein
MKEKPDRVKIVSTGSAEYIRYLIGIIRTQSSLTVGQVLDR